MNVCHHPPRAGPHSRSLHYRSQDSFFTLMARTSMQNWLLFFLYKSECVVHGSTWCFLLNLSALLKTSYFYKRVVLKSILSFSQIPVICSLSSASPKILICDCKFAKCSEKIKNVIQYFLNSKHCISPLNWLKYRPLYFTREEG